MKLWGFDPMKMAATVLVIYLIYCGLLFLLQRKIIFPIYLIDAPAEPREIPGVERIWLTLDFRRIETWYMRPEGGGEGEMPRPAVIFGHGNGEIIDYWPDEMRSLTRMGIGVLLVEYPGYGRSGGSPSEQSITETFAAAYDMLIGRPETDPSKIVLLGRSLGGGAVCSLASQRPSAALVLLSTFTGTKAFAPRYLAPPFLIRDPFDNLSVVRNYAGPVLVLHGRRDEVIPFRHGERLCEAAANCRFIPCNGGHNDCPGDWEVFWEEFADFLSNNGLMPVTSPPHPGNASGSRQSSPHSP